MVGDKSAYDHRNFYSCTLHGDRPMQDTSVALCFASLGQLTLCGTSAGSDLGPLLSSVSDFGYTWCAEAFLADNRAPPPQRVVAMPECAHHLDPLVVPGPSAERSAPTAGCVSHGPSTRGALKGNVGRGCDDKKFVVADMRLVHKTNVGDWEPYVPSARRRYKISGLQWGPREMDKNYQDLVH